MARPLRIDYPGALHHVMSRGNDGIPIFRDDTDRRKLLSMLETITRFRWTLHDWSLMTNHFHLSVETAESNLSDGMHWLLGTYAGWFSRRHKRRGHLYQDRFNFDVHGRDLIDGLLLCDQSKCHWYCYQRRAGRRRGGRGGAAGAAIRPILFPTLSVNHMFPSGPAAMISGNPPTVGISNWEMMPAVVIRPILPLRPIVNQRAPSGPAPMPYAVGFEKF